MSEFNYKEVYERANKYRNTPFIERPYFGSPGAAAQAETNASNIWGHINGGYLFAYEYTRWWEESKALRNTAIVGDWSWLNKMMIRGADAEKFLSKISIRDVSKQQIGQIYFAPMLSDEGNVAIEGLILKLSDNEYMFTQSGSQFWLKKRLDELDLNVEIEDVTPDYTCFALQGPKALEILEAVTGERFDDMKFSRWRQVPILGVDTYIARQGVTGEVGYEFYMPTASGKAHLLWQRIREVGSEFGLRELGFKAQLVGHTETGIATVVRDFLPDRMPANAHRRFAKLWMSQEELDLIDWDFSEQLCTPDELGWGALLKFGHDFIGADQLKAKMEKGTRKFVGLSWNSDDMANLYAAQFRDGPAPPPPDLPYGQFRMHFLPVMQGDKRVGWASGATYSPNLRRMISMARIEPGCAKVGEPLEVIWGGFPNSPSCRIRATVSNLPFIEQTRSVDLQAIKKSV